MSLNDCPFNDADLSQAGSLGSLGECISMNNLQRGLKLQRDQRFISFY